jgi:hypothetical protein
MIGNFPACLAAVLKHEGGSASRRFNWRHAGSAHSFPQRLVFNTACNGKVLQCHTLSSVIYPDGSPPIVRLFFRRCPSAIRRRVVTFYVDTIQRHSLWHISHVGPKILETGLPALAHADSSAAVAGISFVARIIAPPLRRLPRTVRPVNPAWPCKSVSRVRRRCAVRLQAAATIGAVAQLRTLDPAFCATIAAAQPDNRPSLSPLERCQPSIPQARSVDKSRHDSDYKDLILQSSNGGWR